MGQEESKDGEASQGGAAAAKKGAKTQTPAVASSTQNTANTNLGSESFNKDCSFGCWNPSEEASVNSCGQIKAVQSNLDQKFSDVAKVAKNTKVEGLAASNEGTKMLGDTAEVGNIPHALSQGIGLAERDDHGHKSGVAEETEHVTTLAMNSAAEMKDQLSMFGASASELSAHLDERSLPKSPAPGTAVTPGFPSAGDSFHGEACQKPTTYESIEYNAEFRTQMLQEFDKRVCFSLCRLVCVLR